MDLRIIVIWIFPSIVQCNWIFKCDEQFEGTTRVILRMDWRSSILTLNRSLDGNENFFQNSVISCFEHKYNSEVEFLKIQGQDISTPSSLSQSSISSLNLSSIHVRLLFPGAFQNIPYVKRIYLTDNELTSVPKGVFNFLHELKILDLSNNHIYDIDELAFKELVSLNKLLLRRNQLSLIEEKIFQEITNLEILDLSHNQIRTIERFAFRGLNNLMELWLRDNQIGKIDEESFQGIKTLQILDLANNQIHTVGELVFKGLHDLNEIYLNENQISEIGEKTFQEMTKLDILDLSVNSVMEFKFSSGDMRIKRLNLSSNSLETVDFSKFGKCENVDFSQNRISLVTNLEKVEISYLNLSNNRLKQINGTLNNMKILTISQNQLETLHLNFNRPTDLLQLSLTSNHISHLEENIFQGMYSLESLDLSCNNLSLIQQMLFHDLHNLTSLNLSHNHIESFSLGTFNNMGVLHTLDISHNRLLKLDISKFITLSGLQNFYFGYNHNQISSLDVRNLTEHFLYLRTISLVDDTLWNCQELVSVFHHLQQNGVTFLRGQRFDVENLYGVACENSVEVNLKVNGTNSLQYLDNFLRNETSRKDCAKRYELITPIIIIVLLALILISLLIITYFLFFKKVRPLMRHLTLTQESLLEL